MDEAKIISALKRWSEADETFREDLLQQCLSVLGQDDGRELDDADLDMLAAAGEPFYGSDEFPLQ